MIEPGSKIVRQFWWAYLLVHSDAYGDCVNYARFRNNHLELFGYVGAQKFIEIAHNAGNPVKDLAETRELVKYVEDIIIPDIMFEILEPDC